MVFSSPSKGSLNFEQVVDDIIQYIEEDINYSYKLLIGTDSQPRNDGTCFVSAIIIHRQGKGARYFYCKSMHYKIKNIKQRMFYEAFLSLELADKIKNHLASKGKNNMKMEIHLDIGTSGKTRELVREITGMIIGSGFDAKIKPDACAASRVADRYTK